MYAVGARKLLHVDVVQQIDGGLVLRQQLGAQRRVTVS